MEHQQNALSSEVTFHHGPAEGTKRIWATFWLLLVITIMELGLGLLMYAIPSLSPFLHTLIKGIIVILTLAKAFYIISIFMHLGDENRNMIMTLAVPALLFIWFLTAFVWDGNSFKQLRNTHDAYHKERGTPTEQPAHKAPEGQKPGAVD